jgi:hypothetical protein
MAEETAALVSARIKRIADEIGNRSLLGLAHHQPEPWAEPSRCFENVAQKIARDGGRTMFGWTFHHRIVERIPGPGYVFVTHHAVWHRHDGYFVNVTPYPEKMHYPLSPDKDNILFLADPSALPFTTKNMIAPLPLRFFSVVDGDPELDAYVQELSRKERDAWEATTR